MSGLFRGLSQGIAPGTVVAWQSIVGTWRGRVAAVRVDGTARVEVWAPTKGTWRPAGYTQDIPLAQLWPFVAAKVAYEPGTIEAKGTNDDTELYLYGDIGEGGITARDVTAAIRGRNDNGRLDIFLSSPGGNPFEGIAISDVLARWRGKTVVHIDGIAASAATLIAAGARQAIISPDGTYMIHKAWTMAVGDADDMQHTIATLAHVDRIMAGMYSRKTGMTVDELLERMAAEWWMDAATAKKFGFVDAIASPAKRTPGGTQAMFDRPWFARAPRGAGRHDGPRPGAESSVRSNPETGSQPSAAASASNASTEVTPAPTPAT